MKKYMISFGLALGLFLSADAQTKKKQPAAKKPVPQQKATKPTPRPAAKLPTLPASNTTTLSNTATYPALSPKAGVSGLYIADPTVQALTARARGANIRLSGSGVIGVPRGTYGFGKGQLLLRTSGTTSTGTLMGSGAVGTGTSLFGPGTSPQANGVNGKSPYAGPAMWGSGVTPELPVIRAVKERAPERPKGKK